MFRSASGYPAAKSVGILQHSGARVLIVETEFAEKLGETGECPALGKTIRFDPGNEAASPLRAWLATQADGEPDVDPLADDNFLICYTSGDNRIAEGRAATSSAKPSPMRRFVILTTKSTRR